MNALDIADILWETGTMIGLAKGSKTKSQGFLKLSRMVEDLELQWREVETLEQESWDALPEEVKEAFVLLREGEPLPLYQELQEELGEQAAGLLRVRGIGPSMARSIQETLDIWTLEQLEEAAESGRLLEVRGIGKKVLAQLKTQIDIAKETTAAREQKREKLAQKASLSVQIKEALQQREAEVVEEAIEEAPTMAEAARVEGDLEASIEEQQDAEVVEELKEAIEEAPTMAEAEAAEATRHPISDVLRSPTSQKTGLQQTGNALRLPGTGEMYPVKRGIIDLLPEKGSTESLAQRLMESSLYSRVYEELVRPGFTRVLAGHSTRKDIEISLDLLSPERDWGVLDVACGTGQYARTIAGNIDPARGFVIALDLSWSMLKRASDLREKDGLRHLHLVRGDAQELPIADEVLEGVHCTAAFHFFPDPDKALREFHRVLRKEGRLVIGTFLQSKRFFPLRLAQRYTHPITGFRWFDQKELEARIRNAGFHLQQVHIDGLGISLAAVKQ